MEATTDSKVGPRPDRSLLLGWLVLVLALAPSLAAIAWVPEFVTQDGPAHVYNARILNGSLGGTSPLSKTFEVAWQPLPNWGGHLATMAAVEVLPPGPACRVMTALTLVLLASSVVWLRWSVAGSQGLWAASILAVLLAMNVTWLLGFTSFLLGAALMPVTLAVWWGGREWFGAARALGLAGLLVLGYFCHPISLGLTVAGLGLLTICTPGLERVRRGLWTFASFLPLVPLVLAYRALTKSGGGLEPVWEHLANPWSPQSWAAQLGWIDPISLAAKTFRPFSEVSSFKNGAFAPAIWTALAVGLLVLATLKRRGGDRLGWLLLAVILLIAGVVGPDTLGVKHGHYLPQRIFLLGLIALVPWLDFSSHRRLVLVASGPLVVALGLQSAFVWDYAADCRKVVGSLLKAGPTIEPEQRVGTLLVGIKTRFRSNPILHADCLLGAERNAVIWNNYETTHYYFPVKVRASLKPPPAIEFEHVALLNPVEQADERAGIWEAILDGYKPSIDRIVEWTSKPSDQLDAINRRQGYERTFEDGPVRVWSRVPRNPVEVKGSE